MCITRCMPACLVRRHGCCCCLDLRAGSAVAAVATLLFGLSGLAGLAAHLALDRPVLSWPVILNGANCVLVVISGGFLLFGALCKSPAFVAIYLPLSVYTLFTFAFWLGVAVICSFLAFLGLDKEVLETMGGLSGLPRGSEVRLEVSPWNGPNIVGFSFAAVALMLLVYIAVAVNILSVTWTFYLRLRKEERARAMSDMESIVAERRRRRKEEEEEGSGRGGE